MTTIKEVEDYLCSPSPGVHLYIYVQKDPVGYRAWLSETPNPVGENEGFEGIGSTPERAVLALAHEHLEAFDDDILTELVEGVSL
jgi:hypothetical protein